VDVSDQFYVLATFAIGENPRRTHCIGGNMVAKQSNSRCFGELKNILSLL
jgi:hypothetical protein